MRMIHRAVLLSLLTAGHDSLSAAASSPIFEVTAYGAVGDGKTDDTPAIQRAIRAAMAAGGGTVHFSARTYLLDSCSPSPHPWMFYNLIIGSKVTLEGQPGARLLQGPHGRRSLPDRATEVRNTMLAFGPDYTTIRFQNPKYHDGFRDLRPTRAGAVEVTLAKPRDAARFAAGDYVAIYAETTGDILPTEPAHVASVDAATGNLRLRWPLARSFPRPVIAKVTKLATIDVGLKNLIVEGTEPLAATEAFGFTAQDNRFILDTSVGAGNVTGLNLNTLSGFRFTGNRITCSGPSYSILELPQRNSQRGTFEGNTFEVRQMGMGEYAAHWVFTKNTFTLHPDKNTTVGLAIGGFDIDFHHNHVEGGNLTGGRGFGSLVADYIGPDSYAAYVGKIRMADNTLVGRTDGNACLGLFAQDTVVTGNTISVKGSGAGIHAEGPLPQTLTIRDNRLSLDTGAGMVIVTPKRDGSTIVGNQLTGAGSAAGILVASPRTANVGGHTILNNTIRGFATPVSIDRAKHSGTRVQEP